MIIFTKYNMVGKDTTEKYGFIYRWTNVLNGKMYIGSHWGTESDGYVGSGIHFKRAYRQEKHNFVREIIEIVGSDRNLLLEREEYWLCQIPPTERDLYYNLSLTAGGGYNHGHLSAEEKISLYRKWREGSLKWHEKATIERKEQLANSKRKAWVSQPDLVRQHSERTRKRRLLEEDNMTESDRVARSNQCKNAYWSRDQSAIDQHHDNQRNGVKRWHQNKSPELEEQRIMNMVATKKALRLKCINKNGVIKQVPTEHLFEWLSNGWLLGRKPKSLVKKDK